MGAKRKNDPKIITVLGPTSSGKSDLAVSLAKNFDGEIVSADSRQVYKGMDIGTGKVTKEEMEGVPHYLLSVASPRRKFTVSQYQKKAAGAINKILKKEKLPIVCGGTAFYISALVDGMILPEITPDWNFRKELNKENCEELLGRLEKIDPQRAGNIDPKNKRRLVRAVEIVEKTNEPVPSLKKNSFYSPLFLGIKIDRDTLNKKIDKRLQERLKEGMVEEVKNLRKSGISWQRLESFGLEYKWIALYLQEKVSYDEAIKRLSLETKNFSKRQMNWWKGDTRINWIRDYKEAEKLVKNFLKAPLN